MKDYLFFLSKKKEINCKESLKLHKSFHSTQKKILSEYSTKEFYAIDVINSSSKLDLNVIRDFDDYLIIGNFRIDNRNEILNLYPDWSSLDDSELIIKLYKNYQDDVCKYLSGPFSFLIFYKKENKIYGARDIFGQIPMYFINHEDYFAVSSCVEELMPLLKEIEKGIDKIKISQFILGDHFKDGRTFYKKINKINGGNSFNYHLGFFKKAKYIEIKDLISHKKIDDISDQKLYFVMNEVVSSMLGNTNGDVATTLSGGLDSSTVTMFLSKLVCDKNIFAHTVTFDGLSKEDFKKTDEYNYVESVLDNTSLNHEKINLNYNHSGPINQIDQLSFQSQPYGIVNGYIHQSIFKSCQKKNINFLFDGVYGDEIISHGFYRINELILKGKIFHFLYEIFLLKRNGVINSIRHQIKINILKPLYKNFFNKKFTYQFDYADLSNILKIDEENEDFILDYKKSRKSIFKSDLDEQLKMLDSGLIEFSLEQLYELSKVYDVHVMYPFLDKRILIYALNIPSKYKLRNGITRYYFRAAMSNLLPEKILNRNDKSNLSPFAFNQINEKHKIIEYMMANDSNINKYISLNDIVKLKKSKKYKVPILMSVFNIISLQKWFRVIKKK